MKLTKKEMIFPGILMLCSLAFAIWGCVVLPDPVLIHMVSVNMSKLLFVAILFLMSSGAAVMALAVPEKRKRMIILSILSNILFVLCILLHR